MAGNWILTKRKKLVIPAHSPSRLILLFSKTIMTSLSLESTASPCSSLQILVSLINRSCHKRNLCFSCCINQPASSLLIYTLSSFIKDQLSLLLSKESPLTCVPDPILFCIVKDYIPVIILSIYCILNFSLSTGLFQSVNIL